MLAELLDIKVCEFLAGGGVDGLVGEVNGDLTALTGNVGNTGEGIGVGDGDGKHAVFEGVVEEDIGV